MARQSAKRIQGIDFHTPTNPNEDGGLYIWLDETESFGLVWLGGGKWLLMAALSEYENDLDKAGEALKALGVKPHITIRSAA